MSWAAGRRFIILLIVGAVVAAFVAIVGIATFYKSPSCSDSKQNQDETGVDCGGSCAYLCTEQKQPPTVLFTKAIKNGEGRVDVIAKIENKNADAAAKNVRYKVTLYSSDQSLIQEITGTMDIPPGVSVPVFVPNIPSGKQTVVNAFLDIDESSLQWFYMISSTRTMPTVSNIKQIGTISEPRIEAILTNASASVLSNIKAVVLVRNDKGDVIAASSTIILTIPAQGQATATFTWNSEFPEVPASIEVVPIVSLL
ncbi:MAG: hypothetical protein Q8P17_03865 [bacterium]|nr:hypothetical protein [bacterium]